MAGFGNGNGREVDPSIFDNYDEVVAAGSLPDGEYMGVLEEWWGTHNGNGTPCCVFRFAVLHYEKITTLEYRGYWSEAARPHTKAFAQVLGIDLRKTAGDYPPLYVCVTVKNQEKQDGRVFSEVVRVKRLTEIPNGLPAALEARGNRKEVVDDGLDF